MAVDFRFIVIGRGMMGAAAAKYLARQTDGVAVIGPDEPVDRKTHRGVFASHYDEGRITRTIDPDRNWALLANRSIGRYGEIARDSGIDFYREVGCVVVAPDASDYLEKTRQAAVSLGVETSLLDEAGLKAAFPFFAFPEGGAGVFEARGAGHISPRKLVKAQSLLAEKAGATVIRDHVVSIRSEGGVAVVKTAGGQTYHGEKVLLAAGGFSIAENLLPRPVAMTVYARTVTLFEVSEEAAARLATMPSLILDIPDIHIYLLPLIRYPDGKFYLKIGGDPDDLTLSDDTEMRAWFRTEGRDSVRAHLAHVVSRDRSADRLRRDFGQEFRRNRQAWSRAAFGRRNQRAGLLRGFHTAISLNHIGYFVGNCRRSRLWEPCQLAGQPRFTNAERR